MVKNLVTLVLAGLIGLSPVASKLYADISDKVEISSQTLTEEEKEYEAFSKSREEAFAEWQMQERKSYEESRKNRQLMPPFIKTKKKDDPLNDQIDVMGKQINEDENLEQSQIADLKRQKKEFDELNYFEINPTSNWGGYFDNTDKEIDLGKAKGISESIESSTTIARAEYCTLGKKWWGIYLTYGYKISLNGDMTSKWGLDLSKFDGIEFDVKGDGKFRLEHTEGSLRFALGGAYCPSSFIDSFGEIYEIIITPKSEWTHYRLTFDKFTLRKDYQHSMKNSPNLIYTDKKKFDGWFDRSEIHSTEIEFLPRGNPKEKKYIDFKNMRFFKDKK